MWPTMWQVGGKWVASGNETMEICTGNVVTVAWGMGPHGELGFGEKKSSARPDFVST